MEENNNITSDGEFTPSVGGESSGVSDADTELTRAEFSGAEPADAKPSDTELTDTEFTGGEVTKAGGKSGSLWQRISCALYGKKYLALCFAVPVFLLFLIYLFMGVYPFGKNSVLVLDLNGQYVYYFEALRDILTGHGSLIYSFRRALGGEFMGIFAYYLASPLNFIVALFPKDSITEALYTLILLKCGLSGFTFGLYVHKKRPRRPAAAVMFSTMWALCAFCVVMQHNLMWTDCIILLPVVMLGIERLIIKGRGELFVISLCIAVFSNFYIGYMMCIFSALYFFAFYFSKSGEEINPSGERLHFLRRLCRMGVCALFVVCVCAVIILPTYYSLTFGKTTFSDPSYTLEQKNDFLDMLTKLFFGSYDTVRPEGLPFLYTGTLSLLLFPLYFAAAKIPLREKVANGLMCAVLFLSMNASTVDLFWHGMQKPNWLNYRYAFMLCFFFVYLSFRAFEQIREINIKYVLGTALGVGIVLVFMQKQDYDNMPDLACVWVTLGFCLVYVLALRGASSKAVQTHSTACLALTVIVCFEMFASGITNLYALDNDVVFSSRTSYREFIDKLEVPVADIKAADSSFYRMEKTTHRKTNDNMALGIYGLSNSTSTLNAETIKFLNRMGFAAKSHWSKYLGATEVSDSLLGIKYVIRDSESEALPLYDKIKDYGDEKLETYKNPYALSIAYGVSPELTSSDFTDEGIYSPFERMNSLISSMTGEEREVFRPAAEPRKSMTNLSETVTSGHLKYSKINSEGTGSLSFYTEAETGGSLYCYFPSDYTREAKLFVNGEAAGTYFGNETYRIVKLGDFEAGETVSVRLELQKDDLYIRDGENYFCTLDEEQFKSAMAALSSNQLNVTDYTDSSISGSIVISGGNTQVFTSVPYDRGWRITADGKEIEYGKALDALITFSLEEGEHTIEMRYRPDCVTNGALISALGVSAFVLVESGEYIVRRKKSLRQSHLKYKGERA